MQKRKESLGTAKSSEGQFVKKTRKGPLKTTCCNFLDQQLIQNVRDVSLLEVHDVEGLFQLGKKLKGCPYYAARNAITASQVYKYVINHSISLLYHILYLYVCIVDSCAIHNSTATVHKESMWFKSQQQCCHNVCTQYYNDR